MSYDRVEGLMESILTHEEEMYLKHFLSHRMREQRTLVIGGTLLLVFGGLLIVGTILFLLQHLSDQAVYAVGLPGVLAGLALVLLYIWISRREHESQKLLAILSRLVERE
jgi:hypothetical protein